VKIPCGPTYQIHEIANHRRWFAAARCEVQDGFRLEGTLESPVRDTVHRHSLHASRHQRNAEPDGDEAQRRGDAGRFLAEARAEPCLEARRHRRLIKRGSELARVDDERFAGKVLQ
jgi:hypothetical protein